MSTDCIFLSSKMSKRQLEEDIDSSDTVDFLGSSTQRKWSNRRANPRASTYNQKGKLNSDLFQLYFKFVLDIYEAKGRPEAKDEISRIPFLVPKVLQQKIGVEYGNFVLYFMSLFPRSAPESFSIEAGYTYFMKEDWFGPEGYEQFCKELSSSQSVVVID